MNLSNITVQDRLENVNIFFSKYDKLLPFDSVSADEGSIAIESLFWLRPKINLAINVIYSEPRQYDWLKTNVMINAIHHYIKDAFKLQKCEIIPSINGLLYSELPGNLQRDILQYTINYQFCYGAFPRDIQLFKQAFDLV